jgi:hypothetical protein
MSETLFRRGNSQHQFRWGLCAWALGSLALGLGALGLALGLDSPCPLGHLDKKYAELIDHLLQQGILTALEELLSHNSKTFPIQHTDIFL